jgi:anaerobic carbon-monoxide dehydrogenase iron sulfur subunit
MEAKLMHVNPGKCTACRNCEFACAFSHLHEGRPTAARCRAVPEPDQGLEGKNALVICMQCDDAACVKACPANALWRDMKSGAIYHVPERCIQCASCVAACPFGNMRWETVTASPAKCDLCGGDPVCVKFCPTGAIEYR